MNKTEAAAKAREVKLETIDENKSKVALTGHAASKKKKLQNRFLRDLYEFWTGEYEKETIGKNLLQMAADKDPIGFVKMVATMIPKDQATGKTRKTNETNILNVIRGVEIDERAKQDVIELEAGPSSIREASPESEALGILAGKSPAGDK